jgi:hypothetical protein
MSDLVTLAPESVDAVANRVLDAIAERLAAIQLKNTRPELSTAEAMQLTGHRSQSAFYRWTSLRRVKPVAPGRYRRTALLRALGA